MKNKTFSYNFIYSLIDNVYGIFFGVLFVPFILKNILIEDYGLWLIIISGASSINIIFSCFLRIFTQKYSLFIRGNFKSVQIFNRLFTVNIILYLIIIFFQFLILGTLYFILDNNKISILILLSFLFYNLVYISSFIRTIIICHIQKISLLVFYFFTRIISIIFFYIIFSNYPIIYVIPVSLAMAECLMILFSAPIAKSIIAPFIKFNLNKRLLIRRYLIIYIRYSILGLQRFFFRGLDIFLIGILSGPVISSLYVFNKKIFDFFSTIINSLLNSFFIPKLANNSVYKFNLKKIIIYIVTINFLLFFINSFFINLWLKEEYHMLSYSMISMLLCILFNIFILIRFVIDIKGQFMKMYKLFFNTLVFAFFNSLILIFINKQFSINFSPEIIVLALITPLVIFFIKPFYAIVKNDNNF
jgi:hypothetical protein